MTLRGVLLRIWLLHFGGAVLSAVWCLACGYSLLGASIVGSGCLLLAVFSTGGVWRNRRWYG